MSEIISNGGGGGDFRAFKARFDMTPIQRESRDAFLARGYRFEEVSCICGATAGTLIADHDRFGIPVGVILCSTCGLARTSPRLAAEHLPEFYEDHYHGLHFGIREPSAHVSLFRKGQGAQIERFLRIRGRAVRVAEIGAGTGQVLREFEAAYSGPVAATGCEYSAAFVKAGRKAGTDLLHGGPETLEGEFDVVILSHVVEHFPDPIADLETIRKLGHDQTLFYVEVPGLLTIDDKPEYDYSLERYLTLAHTYHFTLTSLSATMARAGFILDKGDERVRTVFRWGNAEADVQDPQAVLNSLARLNDAGVRRRRALQRAKRASRAAIKSVLPEPVVQWVKTR